MEAHLQEEADHDLQLWYRQLHPVKLDIVGDFAGKELFAIHGESLVSHCVSQAQVDFGNGFQLLHAIHAVEVFLAKLKERGCHFHILWFDRHEELCVPPRSPAGSEYKYDLTRAVLIEHLGRAADVVGSSTPKLCYRFSGIDCDQFRDYLATHAIHFIMCSEGNSGDQAHGKVDNYYRHIVHEIARAGYCTAFINDVEFRSSRVHARLLSPPPTIGSLRLREPPARDRPDWHVSKLIGELKVLAQSTCQGIRARALSGRDITTLLALAAILGQTLDGETKRRAVALLVHTVVLRKSQLSLRACSEPAAPCLLTRVFLKDVCQVAINALDQWRDDNFTSQAKWDCFDLLDGRIYLHILKGLPQLSLDEDVISDVGQLTKAVEALTNVDLSDHIPSRAARDTSCVSHISPKGKSGTSSVLAFSHPVVDHYLQDINVTTAQAHGNPTKIKAFEELTHWHNAKRPIDPKRVPRVRGYFARQRNQKFMADTIAYSASLTNASGKNIEPETVAVQPSAQDQNSGDKRSSQWREELKKKQASKQAKQKKQQVNSGQENARQAVLALRAEKLGDRSVAIVNFWHERCKEFEREESLVKRYLKATKYLSRLPRHDMETIGGEATLYACDILGRLMTSTLERAESMGILAMLWSKTVELHNLPLTRETSQHMATLDKILGIVMNPRDGSTLTARPLPFAIVVDNLAARAQLPMGALEFQLEHCGPYLDRSFDSAPDPRVPFSPDSWQRKVLDAIDADKSLLVIAPTSAGKTFISFYAMKKTLQGSDEGVLVYVAPTKALVNQIAAEIQARFSKTYNHEGKSVWAIHTRDYRVNNPTGCQILVTVPHVLQIMLLAPSNAAGPTSWSRRVRRIIFDEVHSIGQAEDGVIWEQLLLLAPCPIIALSATVGNPDQFKSWLEGTQKEKGFELELVVHASRYSDLRKFIYLPPKEYSFHGFDSLEQLPLPGLDARPGDASRFALLHPIGAIVDRNRGDLDDISLEPRDCLTLWNCMSKHQTRNYPVEESLRPQRSLPPLVTKSNATEWETALKARLQTWMAKSNSPFSSVCKELRPDEEQLSDALSGTQSMKRTKTASDPSDTSLLSLLVDLRSRGSLPALVFNYDRTGCEDAVLGLLKHLQSAEQVYRQSSPEWKKKMAKFETHRKNIAKVKAKAAKKTTSKRRDLDEPMPTKADLDREDASQEPDPWDSFDPDAPLEEFSFADSVKIPGKELKEMMSPLEKIYTGKEYIWALQRGLGIHHAGMNRKYRQVVEILFRKGYLTVVIATGTLAMGINMPCKTVVFLGDSVFLTALNYRQASGRAGRRGFDILGNVVFHGIPQHRAFEIMSTRLPDLKGQFPTSVTLILRLFVLLHGTNNSDYAVKAMESMLSQTRLYLGGPSSQMSIKHHLRFSIDYLRRQHLLSPTGVPMNFSGLVGHLYFTENAVFAFHSLLKDGYFHKVCADMNRRKSAVLLDVLLVLLHLFCRVPCYRHRDKSWLDEVVRPSPSIVILPRLPAAAEAILREHNQETLRIFKGYVSTFVNQHLSDNPDCELPFTSHRAGSDTASDLGCSLPHLPPTIIRSPFAALSGFTDEFGTIGELCSGVRGGVYLEESAIPYIPIYPEETRGVPFNAYIYDFFKHGDMKALVRDNGIKSGDVWFLLKDFSLVLATIVASLANFLDTSAAADDAAMIDVQDAGDVMEETTGLDEKDDEPEDGHGGAHQAGLRGVGPSVGVGRKKGKQKVADSWDDGSSEDETEERARATRPSRNTASDGTTPSWEGDGRENLQTVYTVMKMLQDEFNERFMNVWA